MRKAKKRKTGIIVCVICLILIFCGSSQMKQYKEMNSRMLYQLAKRSVVRITMKQSAGSGIIWEWTDDSLVIVSNRHLLMEDVEGDVTFWNGISLHAEMSGYSQQYDIAFLCINRDNIPSALQHEILPARKMSRENWEGKDNEERIRNDEFGDPVIQIGSSGEAAQDMYQGVTENVIYIPEFNTEMLRTRCYAKAGMSGGGVFSEDGYLLGMITGGEGADSGKKEAQVTYSIPTQRLDEEYRCIDN